MLNSTMNIETENKQSKAREKLREFFVLLNTSRVAAVERYKNGNWWFPFILKDKLVDEALHSILSIGNAVGLSDESILPVKNGGHS